ncbi:MAG: hypothetical protein PHC33_00710 [Candidatus Omnitrophica bacterium]|nr:hypothetical protein [Candidatus Omnitrophota bacterium]
MEEIIPGQFKEEIYLFPKVLLVILLAAGGFFLWNSIRHFSLSEVFFILIVFFIPFLFGKMAVTVLNGELRVRFGYFRLINFIFPLSDILTAEEVSFGPIRDFGGWGIRCGRFRGKPANCLTMRGNKGVLLVLRRAVRICFLRTDNILIGVRDPGALLRALGKRK